MSNLKTNKSNRFWGDFCTRVPKKEGFTEYIYTFADGTKTAISREGLSQEVDDLLYEEIKRENNNNRTQTEEHRVYDKDQEKHQALLIEVADENDIASLVELQLRDEEIRTLIKTLKESEQILIFKKYYQEKSNTQIALEEGVTEGAIRDRLNRLHKKIKKTIKGD